jgi:cytochrome c
MPARLTTLHALTLGAALALPALAHAAADPAKGETLFKQRCSACHSVVEDTGPRPAPSLKGVVGRKAAANPTFKYSPALKGANLTWTSANLDKFLANPAGMVPGTFMVISVPNADERGDVLAYLAQISGGRAAAKKK